MKATKSTSWFQRFAKCTSQVSGSPTAFGLALGTIIVWGITGPLFGFSDTWQLVINTGTTIVTFLMVFLIQNTQNRDAQAIQVKLDELIRCTSGAHVALLDLEELDDRELGHIRREYEALAERARAQIAHGKSDTGTPRIGARRRRR
jgi:low affinity Fe/Cu permease